MHKKRDSNKSNERTKQYGVSNLPGDYCIVSLKNAMTTGDVKSVNSSVLTEDLTYFCTGIFVCSLTASAAFWRNCWTRSEQVPESSFRPVTVWSV